MGVGAAGGGELGQPDAGCMGGGQEEDGAGGTVDAVGGTGCVAGSGAAGGGALGFATFFLGLGFSAGGGAAAAGGGGGVASGGG